MPRKTTHAASAKIVLCLGLEGAERKSLPADLLRFGYHPVSASFAEGLSATMAGGEVRLVIIDLSRSLPKAMRMLDDLRSHAGSRDLPVLLLLPLAGMESIPPAMEAGADDYLLKPVDSRLLFSRVQQLAEAFPRMHCRVQCEVPLEALVHSEFMTGETLEVSEGGLRGVLPRKVATGDLAVLRFHLPRHTEQVAAAAVCVYSRKSSSGWAAGFKYVLIEKAHQKRIQRFIDQAEADKACPPPLPRRGRKKSG